MKWIPIETAPKDGTPIFCWWHAADLPNTASCRCKETRWGKDRWSDSDGKWGWLVGIGIPPDHYHPTHWMPLPAPPMTDSPPAGEML